MSYEEIWRRSLSRPDEFWSEAAEKLVWQKRWERTLDDSNPPHYRWFAGGEINTCHNAIDRHVEDGFGDSPALIYDSPMSGQKRVYTYAEARAQTAAIGGALLRAGVKKGEAVIIYMPMIPEAVFAMLACARIGAPHSVVFGGFGARELAARIDDCRAAFVLSASCGLEPGRVVDYKKLLDDALSLAQRKVKGCAILQRERHRVDLRPGRDIDWEEFIDGAPPAECARVAATDPLYILYTSGTTGAPKGIVRDNGGHAVALLWSMAGIYDVRPGEVFWAASDIGWVVGHSYIVYAPFLRRATTVLYEGKPVGTPDAGAFWRVIAEHRVAVMFTAPTALRAIKKEDPQGESVRGHDLSRLRAQFVAGERCDPDTLAWAEKHLRAPVVDHWWQTETGWAITANPLGIEKFAVPPGAAGKPMPGYDLRVLDDDGVEEKRGELGNLAVKLPLPPSCFPTIWGDDDRYVSGYFTRYPGYYLSGDSGLIDADGFAHVMSRIDDVINVAAHRLSTGAMEEILCAHPDVAEAAVFGVRDDLKGELPLALFVLNRGAQKTTAEAAAELIAKVRTELGPVAAFKSAAAVARLPKTRSGKVLRATMRKMANGDDYETPPTIDDPAIIPEISAALKTLGYPKGA